MNEQSDEHDAEKAIIEFRDALKQFSIDQLLYVISLMVAELNRKVQDERTKRSG